MNQEKESESRTLKLPWSVIGGGVFNAQGNPVTVDDILFDREFVVAAVNCYKRMREVLIDLHDAATDARDLLGGSNPPISKEVAVEHLTDCLALARSVLGSGA